MNEEKCSCCGAVCNRYLMEPIFTGKGTQYLCNKCYRKGSRSVIIRLMNKQRQKKQYDRQRRNN